MASQGLDPKVLVHRMGCVLSVKPSGKASPGFRAGDADSCPDRKRNMWSSLRATFATLLYQLVFSQGDRDWKKLNKLPKFHRGIVVAPTDLFLPPIKPHVVSDSQNDKPRELT